MTGKQFERTRRLLGDENTRILGSKTIAIAGIGAVGGYALEALARIGIGHFILVDFDRVSESNINRQILALHSTIGELKTDAAECRVMDINPECTIEKYPVVISSDNLGIFSSADVILDCIDSLGAKIELLSYAYEHGIPAVSSMGAALRRSVMHIHIADIMDTYGCPLAKEVRKGLRKRGIGKGIQCVFSSEEVRRCVFSSEEVRFTYRDPDTDSEAENMPGTERKRPVLGSLPTVTAVFGEYMAELALKNLLPAGTMDSREVR